MMLWEEKGFSILMFKDNLLN